jgi:hypothetical protein
MQNPNDPFAFLKAQWPDLGSSFQMPQAAMTSLDPQVIDKRIEDLKTVEQWLSFNLNLVKSTIQGLEIQKGTLAAIQSFQQSMQDFGQPSDSASERGGDAPTEQSPNLNQAAMAQASDWWNGMQQQFQHFVQAAQQATQQATQPGAGQPEAKDPTTKSASRNKKAAPTARARTTKSTSRRTSPR